jgi:membrane protein insertase Oxa1/YidC/SpoIIIJ
MPRPTSFWHSPLTAITIAAVAAIIVWAIFQGDKVVMRYILPVLLGVSMFLMQWLSMRSMPDQNPQMKFMMYFMPIFMVIIFLNLASGLNLYYASMNFASLPQQLMIMRERKRRLAGNK